MAQRQTIDIRLAQDSDLDEILSLLKDVGLPVVDLVPPYRARFLVATCRDTAAGCVGVESTGSHALIRSLAVESERRQEGIGSRLLEAAEALCRHDGLRAVYLLTMTAERFFARRGYVRIERDCAPDGIAATTEFGAVCPASSAFMMKPL